MEMARSNFKIEFCHMPNEVLRLVVSNVKEKKSLLQLRRTNRIMCEMVNEIVFRSVQLGVCRAKYAKPSDVFLKIAQSDRLRKYVQIVSIDSEPYAQPSQSGHFSLPDDFIASLPYIRHFHNLRVLHMRIQNHDISESRHRQKRVELSIWIVKTIFHCLAGTYTPQIRKELNRALRPYLATIPFRASEMRMNAIHIQELTVHGCNDEITLELARSPAINAVFSQTSLTDFKLLMSSVNTRNINALRITDTHPHLPRTWLQPSLAASLKALSLYWCPRLEGNFIARLKDQAFWPGGPTALMLPCLKKLTLGSFVFSHFWQAIWISEIGRGGRSEGLEELRLLNCSILARRFEVFDVEDEAKQEEDSTADDMWIEAPHCVKWEHVFNHWIENMPKLEVFEMRTGLWPDPTEATMGIMAQQPMSEVEGQHPANSSHSDVGSPSSTESINSVDGAVKSRAPADPYVYLDVVQTEDTHLEPLPNGHDHLNDPITKVREHVQKGRDRTKFALLRTVTDARHAHVADKSEWIRA